MKETSAAILTNTRPSVVSRLHLPHDLVTRGLHDAAAAFAHTYWVAWGLVLLTMVPALMLPRRRDDTHLLDEEDLPPVVVG